MDILVYIYVDVDSSLYVIRGNIFQSYFHVMLFTGCNIRIALSYLS